MGQTHTGNPRQYIRSTNQDPYRDDSKHPGYRVCTDCKAVNHQGRWRWAEQMSDDERAQLKDAAKCLCPACRRSRDNYPGGVLSLSGPFFEKHQEEVLNLVANIEAQEKQLHPLNRLISQTRQGHQLSIAFTDAHLARAVAEALRHAWQGELELKYGEDESFLRASWRR